MLQNSQYTEIWENDTDDVDTCITDSHILPTNPAQTTDKSTSDSLMAFATFILLWQFTYAISDRCITALLRFMSYFVKLLAKLSNSPMLENMSLQFPTSLYKLRKIIHLDKQAFKELVVCPKCHSIYTLESCKKEVRRDMFESHQCTFQRFPHHPQVSRRSSCNATLLRKVVSPATSKIFLYPWKVYCYKSIINTLSSLFNRPNFMQKLNSWRTRPMLPNGYMKDIFDGQIWKEFMSEQCSNFLQQPMNLLLMLNVDWFQPYKHVAYSVGVIYLTIQNLPRHERFLKHNLIICGVIPGPKEPHDNINSYLKPLIEELQLLWRGVRITGDICIRVALCCVACDIPATRKTLGFVSHSAMRGCSKCLKSFMPEGHRFGEKLNYGGFDKESWPLRDSIQHNLVALQHKQANTALQRKEIEQEYGIKYSVLCELPYFKGILSQYTRFRSCIV